MLPVEARGALWFEVATDAFILVEHTRLLKPVKATVDRARKDRAKAPAAAGATQKAARALVEEGRLSVRDAADILGLSQQCVQQILAS